MLPAARLRRGPGQILGDLSSPALSGITKAAQEHGLALPPTRAAAHVPKLSVESWSRPTPASPRLAAWSGDRALPTPVPRFAGDCGDRRGPTRIYVELWDPWVRVLIDAF